MNLNNRLKTLRHQAESKTSLHIQIDSIYEQNSKLTAEVICINHSAAGAFFLRITVAGDRKFCRICLFS